MSLSGRAAGRRSVDPKAQAVNPDAGRDPGARIQADKSRGDADGALALAPVKVDVTYDMARENHNPMEPHATTAAWNGDRLTLWSKSQFVINEQAEIAAIFGIPAENVQVICPFVGGAFGTSLRTWAHVTLAAIAARQVKRPVKLVLARKQMFFATGHRPRTIQRLALGAAPDGKLASLIHEGTGDTSRYEQYTEPLTTVSSYMYSCPNVRTRYRLLPLDISTSTWMRGPGEASGMYALECAVDELAYALGIDPIELRRRNEPEIDQGENRPFSSRALTKCYDLGAARFGWSRRDPRPRSMRDGRFLIGIGVASATYPAEQAPSGARVRLKQDGVAEVEVAASDMGPGTYTSMTQVAAEMLGLAVEQIRFSLGRSDFPPAPPHGSMTMASVGSAIAPPASRRRRKREARYSGSTLSRVRRALDDVEWNEGGCAAAAILRSQPYRDIVASAGQPIEALAQRSAIRGRAPLFDARLGAVFAEVAVDPDVGTIRVRARSGLWGGPHRQSAPRREPVHQRHDRRHRNGADGAHRPRSSDGRPVNAHMADYLVPVMISLSLRCISSTRRTHMSIRSASRARRNRARRHGQLSPTPSFMQPASVRVFIRIEDVLTA
jgi:xanthine dehydrogenase YagR molybdenum-binding subunit